MVAPEVADGEASLTVGVPSGGETGVAVTRVDAAAAVRWVEEEPHVH
jgi:hypothetical protein